MYAKEVNEAQPAPHPREVDPRGLGKGNLGVVMSRAGVGKTACLVQIGLDDLMRDKDVLHVALGYSVEHVSTWYDALFDDLASHTELADREATRASVARHRVIKTWADHDLSVDRLEKAITMFDEHLGFKPAAILIDGYDWCGGQPHKPGTSSVAVAQVAAELGAFKAIAKRLDAELMDQRADAPQRRRRSPDAPRRAV